MEKEESDTNDRNRFAKKKLTKSKFWLMCMRKKGKSC